MGKAWALLIGASLFAQCSSFLVPKSFEGSYRRTGHGSRAMSMRDSSKVTDFVVNDIVKVKTGIVLDGRDWSGMVGQVVSTWEKCETDPACCCAELATEGAIRVDFSGDKSYNFFAENELEKVTELVQ